MIVGVVGELIVHANYLYDHISDFGSSAFVLTVVAVISCRQSVNCGDSLFL